MLEIRWTDGTERCLWQVLTLERERIVHIQDCRTAAKARRLAGLDSTA